MSHPVHVRPAGPGDVPKLWAWRNDPAVRAVSRRRRPLEFDDFRGEALDPRVRWLVVSHAAEEVGYVKLSPSSGAWEIGIALGAATRGRGVGRQAITAAVAALRSDEPGARIVARVRPGNEPSARAFRAAGFALQGGDDEYEVYVLEPAPGGAGISRPPRRGP